MKPDTIILRSQADDVIPFADFEELATNSGATLIEVGIDHRLADPEPLARCSRRATTPEVRLRVDTKGAVVVDKKG